MILNEKRCHQYKKQTKDKTMPKTLDNPTEKQLQLIKEYFKMEGSNLVWKKSPALRIKQGSNAGAHHGDHIMIMLKGYRIFAAQVAWFLQLGYWPEKKVYMIIQTVDRDRNLNISNLTMGRIRINIHLDELAARNIFIDNYGFYAEQGDKRTLSYLTPLLATQAKNRREFING